MRIALLSAGTGSYYCGSCMRDNSLVRGLCARGHQAHLVPLYLPLALDEPPADACPLFLGGINSYLQHSFGLFRHTPRWLDAVFDRPALLRSAGERAGSTDPASLVAMTHDMLLGPAGRQRKEIARLCRWLDEHGPWDAILLSNGLLAGLQPALARLAPVFVTLQGEDSFLDGMPEPARSQAYALMAHHCRAAAGRMAVSADYARRMRQLLACDDIAVCENGIDLDGWAPAAQAPSPPVIGFFAHLSPSKGLHAVVEGFRAIAAAHPQLRLHIGGSCTRADRPYLDQQLARLHADGLAGRVTVVTDPDRAGKIAFLQGCSLLSVAPTYQESFGLYALEAVAAGAVPVLPRSGALPEILAALDCGLVCAEATELPAAWERALAACAAERARVLAARPLLERRYGLGAMAARVEAGLGARPC